jgi:hypothetical protein
LFRCNNQYPLAINTNQIVTNLWLILNKGFGKNDLPSSFDLVTRAQIVLAARLSGKVTEKFEKLKEDYKSGFLDKEEAYARILEYRKMAKLPEEINESTIEGVLLDLNQSELENRANEMQKLQVEYNKIKSEATELHKRQIEFDKVKNEALELRKENELIKQKNELDQESEKRIITELSEDLFRVC